MGRCEVALAIRVARDYIRARMILRPTQDIILSIKKIKRFFPLAYEENEREWETSIGEALSVLARLGYVQPLNRGRPRKYRVTYLGRWWAMSCTWPYCTGCEIEGNCVIRSVMEVLKK